MNFMNTNVMNIDGAIRGMRNPMNSHEKSDSNNLKYIIRNKDNYERCKESERNLIKFGCDYYIGDNDLNLAQRLIKSGSDHRKFLRQIIVCVDITAPLYWWKEYDTYKVGTVANSESTMHRIHSYSITPDCFEMSERTKNDEFFIGFIDHLEELRKEYVETKDKNTWKSLIEQLPSSWLQTRTCTMSYENLISMYYARKTHKLSEWHTFCVWVNNLPYAKELILCVDKE